MTFNITAPLTPATPFFAGQNATFTSVPLNAVALQDRVYAVDLKEYRHVGLPPFREGVVASNEPSDLLFNPNGGWWRYRYDWSLGMGQENADLDDDVLGRRYDTSEHLDPWTKHELKLQHTLESIATFPASGKPIFTRYYDGDREFLLVSNSGACYVVDKNGSIHGTLDATYGLGRRRPYGDNIIDVLYVATLGNTVYSFVLDGWTLSPSEYRINKGTLSWTGTTVKYNYQSYSWSAVVGSVERPTLFRVVGNSLLVGMGNVLYEFIDGTGLVELFTHPIGTFRWTTAFNIGSRIYAGGWSTEQSNVYAFTTTSTGNLAVSSQATVLPSDERIRGGFGYGGNAILWGNLGIRFATIGGDGSLTYGNVIETHGPVNTAAAAGKYIYFNWETTDNTLQLGRMSLEEFTDSLTPAYATDLATSNAASVYDLYACSMLEDAGSVMINDETFGDRYVYVYGSDHKLYAENLSAYETSGYFTSGELYFGTAENKSLGRVEVRFDALQENESVTCEIIDSETQQVIGFRTVGIPGEQTLSVTPQGYTFNRAYLKLTLESDGTSTPVIRQWKISAYPVAPATQQWTIALIVGQVVLVGSGEGQLVSYDPWAEIEYVRNLWRSRQVFTYTEGTHSYRVRVENFSVEPIKWDDSGEWLEIILNVQLISVE